MLRWSTLGLLLLAVAAQAATPPPGMSITPLRVDLRASERGSAVTLTNTGPARKTVQVETWAWSQAHDEDVYTETHDLLVNPPLLFIEPGQSQVVRVGRASALPPSAPLERSYRVYFREVLDDSAVQGPTLRVALRIGIPVFLEAGIDNAVAQLDWSGVVHKDGSVDLYAENHGLAHARVTEVRVLAAGNPQVLAHAEGFRYVLPGARQKWTLPASAALKPGAARVAASLEQGASEFPLALRAE